MAAKTLAGALSILIAAVAVSSPLDGRDAPFLLRDLSQQAQFDDESDDGLLVSDTPFLLPGQSPVGDSGNWVKFQTDECGVPNGIQSGGSMLRKTGLDDDDDMDVLDGDDDPADRAWGMISDWFSAEPEIAVVNDGVDTSCNDGFPVFDDSEPQIIARWRHPTSLRNVPTEA